MSAWSAEHGQILKRLRLKRGLSLNALGKLVGCSGSRIREIEEFSAHGRPTGPSPALWHNLAKVFGEELPAPPENAGAQHQYKNRTLTPNELKEKFNPLLADVTKRLGLLSEGDGDLLWALRRKLAKELQYQERGTPMHRQTLKRKKSIEQDGKCAACLLPLPERGAVLDRIEAMKGYTLDNTRLLCPACDADIQRRRGYR